LKAAHELMGDKDNVMFNVIRRLVLKHISFRVVALYSK
jgi:hypothetical protein